MKHVMRDNETPEAFLERSLTEVEERIRVARRNLKILVALLAVAQVALLLQAFR